MEALCVWPLEGEAVRVEGGEPEDEDEEEEPEPPPVVRRKVSFADAFGLDLVSVKEFDEAAESDAGASVLQPLQPLDEFHMSCLFAVPSSPEELEQRLQDQMVELESLELLPGSSTLRGVVRVVNLSYGKSVCVRLSLDRWSSCFELPAEYVPGSSDMKTDRFCFHYTLLPPFDRDGSRLEFCLRYETSAGTFWANNKEMNYVVFWQQRAQVKEPRAAEDERRGGCRGNRSCLKAKRRGSAEARESILMAALAAEAVNPHKAEEADRNSEIHSLLNREELKPLVVNAKTRQRAARLARVQDHFYQKTGKASGREWAGLQPPWADSAGVLHHLHRKQPGESQQVLTYHHIPLYTLDWSSDKSHSGTNMDDLWSESAKLPFSKALEAQIKDASSASDIWKSSINDGGEVAQETSVCDVWRAFLDGPSFPDHSGVPESEWLQTAASVSPSLDKDLQTATTRTAACRPPAAAQEASVASIALSGEDGQQAEAHVGTPGEENTETGGASGRSQANSGADGRQKFGETLASQGSIHPSAGRPEEQDRRQEGEEGSVSGTGTSWEESGKPAADVPISEGSSLEEGVCPRSSSSSIGDEEEVTSTTNGSDTNDSLAFEETKDGEAGAGGEDGIATEATESKTQGGEEIFRPRKPEESEIPPRSADEKQRRESGLKQNSENRLKLNERDEREIKAAPSHGVNPKQTWEEDSPGSRRMSGDFTPDQSENQAVEDKYVDLGLEEADTSKCARSDRKEEPTREVDEEEEDAPTASEEISEDEEESRSCRGITAEHRDPCAEIHPSVKVLQGDAHAEQRRTPSDEGEDEDAGAGTGREDVDTSPETLARAEAGVSPRGRAESVAVRAPRERQDGEERRRDRRVHGAPCGQPEKLAAGTQEPIMAESAAALQVMGAASERALLQRFGEDLVRGVWEEVFAQSAGAQAGGGDGGESAAAAADGTPRCPPSPQRDWESLRGSNPAEECGAPGREELPEHLATNPRGRGHDRPMPEPLRRHAAPEAPGGNERWAPDSAPTGLTLWRLLHILSQLTRLAMGGALVGGVCVVVLLYDFPAILALYAITLGWWFYTWRRHARAAKAGMVG